MAPRADFLRRTGPMFLALALCGEAAGGPRAEDGVPKRGEFLVIPLRVHVLTSADLPEIHCRLSDADVARVVRKVNGIWHRAGIHWGLESTVREPAARQGRFRLAREVAGDDVRLYPLLIPEGTRAFEGLHLYFVHDFPVNGIYMGDDYAIVRETASLREVEGGIDEPVPRVAAHELGHALGLAHRQDRTNLLASGTTGTGLNAEEFRRAREGARSIAGASTVEDLRREADEAEAAGDPRRARRLRAWLSEVADADAGDGPAPSPTP